MPRCDVDPSPHLRVPSRRPPGSLAAHLREALLPTRHGYGLKLLLCKVRITRDGKTVLFLASSTGPFSFMGTDVLNGTSPQPAR